MKKYIVALFVIALIAVPVGGFAETVTVKDSHKGHSHQRDISVHDKTAENYEKFDFGKKLTGLYAFNKYLKSGASYTYEHKRNEHTLLWETVFEFGPGNN